MAAKKKSENTKEENVKISDCIESFRIVNEGVDILFKRPVEREWASYLLKKYGGPSVLNPEHTQLEGIIKFLPAYNKIVRGKSEKIPFGTIRKPSELVTFLGDLMTIKRKYDLDTQHKLHLKNIEKAEKENFEKQKEIITDMSEEQKEERKKKSEEFKKRLRGY